jgi:hypothetical protein
MSCSGYSTLNNYNKHSYFMAPPKMERTKFDMEMRMKNNACGDVVPTPTPVVPTPTPTPVQPVEGYDVKSSTFKSMNAQQYL